jgi:hypothetical protein
VKKTLAWGLESAEVRYDLVLTGDPVSSEQ